MATVQAFVWMKARDGRAGSRDDGSQTLSRNLEFTRVPVVGEFVNLGDDTGGHSADYRVVVVVHAPLQPSGVDAEIYMERVILPHELSEADKRIAASPPDRSELRPRDAK
jgi:hypothetical protein